MFFLGLILHAMTLPACTQAQMADTAFTNCYQQTATSTDYNWTTPDGSTVDLTATADGVTFRFYPKAGA